MFKSITFRRGETASTTGIDLGLLAETLLFYRQCNLLLDTTNLSHLLSAIGPDTTQRLISSSSVTPTLIRDNLGVHSSKGLLPVHDFIQFEVIGSEERGYLKSKQARIKFLFERSLGKSAATNKAAITFAKSVEEKKISFDLQERGGLPGLARADLADTQFVQNAVKVALQELVPTARLPNNLSFVPHKVESGFAIQTNLDFNYLNQEYQKFVPAEHSSLSPQFLLTYLLEARAGIQLASAFSSDLMTSPAASRIIQLKLDKLVSSTQINSDEIELFQRITIGNGGAIREAINSGERTFDEFLDLLDHASQFKTWIADQKPEKSLIEDYYSALTSKTWAEKLPTKTFRFVVFTGAGILTDLILPTGLGTATGLAMGAGDTFVLDKVLKGWKPNQFVEGPLHDFVE